jgi:GxxExxY protein
MTDKVLLKEEVYNIVSCALEICDEVGHGFHEKPYENALVIEFALRDIPYAQQKRYPITYKGHEIGSYIPDLIAYDSVIVDTKVIEKITNHERGQILNYLKISGLRVGLIINFKHKKLEWERLVN